MGGRARARARAGGRAGGGMGEGGRAPSQASRGQRARVQDRGRREKRQPRRVFFERSRVRPDAERGGEARRRVALAIGRRREHEQRRRLGRRRRAPKRKLVGRADKPNRDAARAHVDRPHLGHLVRVGSAAAERAAARAARAPAGASAGASARAPTRDRAADAASAALTDAVSGVAAVAPVVVAADAVPRARGASREQLLELTLHLRRTRRRQVEVRGVRSLGGGHMHVRV